MAKPTLELLKDAPLIGPEEYHPIWDDVYCDILGQQTARHFDRNGEPISMRTWCRLREAGGEEYLRVGADTIGPYHVSTVWLGLDHGMGDPDRPVIFETMVFATEWSYYPRRGDLGGFHYHQDFDARRYCTEQEALDGHRQFVEEISLLVAINPDWRPEDEGYAPVDNDEDVPPAST